MNPLCVGELLRTKAEIEWRIPNFFALPVEMNQSIFSHSFHFRGATWCLHMLPHGENINPTEDDISMYICRVDRGSPKTLTFTFALKLADGTLRQLFEDTQTLPEVERGFGLKNALKRSELIRERAYLVPANCLTIICFLRMFPEPVRPIELAEATTQTSLDCSFPEPINAPETIAKMIIHTPSECSFGKLSRDLSELLVSGENSDMTVRVKEREFKLHRGIMGARVPVFHSMLRHEMTENATGTVCIDDCEEDVFQAFVDYVYSGRVDKLCTDTVFDLFVLADKYQVEELALVSVEGIKSMLSVDTFCDAVTLALTYDKKELLQKAADFLANNMAEIIKTKKWMNLMTAKPLEANDLLLQAVSKK